MFTSFELVCEKLQLVIVAHNRSNKYNTERDILLIANIYAVAAMKALKESLRVPDRMGWNGDPCAPTTWDAWEGVTCHPLKDEEALVVSQM